MVSSNALIFLKLCIIQHFPNDMRLYSESDFAKAIWDVKTDPKMIARIIKQVDINDSCDCGVNNCIYFDNDGN